MDLNQKSIKDFNKIRAKKNKEVNLEKLFENDNYLVQTLKRTKRVLDFEQTLLNEIRKLEKTNKKISTYQRFVDAFEKDLDIDPGRLMGLTDGIFSIVMTLLVFGMVLPDKEILNYTGFINFLGSIGPIAGLIIVSFIVLGSFWIYHHEFMKIKSLNMPYLWLNIFYLACLCFIPFNISYRELFTFLLGKCNIWSEYTFSYNILFNHVPLCTQERIP